MHARSLLRKPWRDQRTWSQRRISPPRVKQAIGVVPEELALFDRLSGHEYLVFVGRMYGLDKATIRTRTTELLQLMNLHEDEKLKKSLTDPCAWANGKGD